MKLLKDKSREVILNDVKTAGNPLQRVKGLLFTKEIARGYGLLLKPCNGIHTIGMRYSIDVLYLSRDGIVQKILQDLKPGRLGPIHFKTASVVEMRAGTLKNLELQPGDKLVFEKLPVRKK